MGSRPRSDRLSLYLVVVCGVGLPALLVAVVHGREQLWAHHTQIAWLAPLIILGEVIPIRVPRGDNYEELTVSTTFALALLLMAGPAAALVAMTVASIFCDAIHRRPLSRYAFNVAQYSLSLLSSALVLERLGVGALGE